jgi:tetratricopeptide (TPR) repeat protein
MDLPSFPVPPSLAAYVRLFQESPEKAISKMETAFQKRRSDPILLAWLCWMWLKQGNRVKALHAANCAITLAPGSPIIAQLRYLCAHPSGFQALNPAFSTPAVSIKPTTNDFGVPFDLDSLITNLSLAGQRKISLVATDEPTVDLAQESAKRGQIATQTLAIVHEKQGRVKEALDVYRQLLAAKPDMETTYAEHIARLTSKLAETD